MNMVIHITYMYIYVNKIIILIQFIQFLKAESTFDFQKLIWIMDYGYVNFELI